MSNLAFKLEFDSENHKYIVDGKERISTTALLKRNGLYKNTQYATDEHLWRGRAIHEAMHYHHKGTLDTAKLDQMIVPYMDGWFKFERETGFKATGWERQLWHPVYDYCGTPDVWGNVGDEFWIPDYKSGIVPRVTGLQLASYEMLLQANGFIEFGQKVRRVGIQLMDTGDYRLEPFNDPVDMSIWQMIISVHNWSKNNS